MASSLGAVVFENGTKDALRRRPNFPGEQKNKSVNVSSGAHQDALRKVVFAAREISLHSEKELFTHLD